MMLVEVEGVPIRVYPGERIIKAAKVTLPGEKTPRVVVHVKNVRTGKEWLEACSLEEPYSCIAWYDRYRPSDETLKVLESRGFRFSERFKKRPIKEIR